MEFNLIFVRLSGIISLWNLVVGGESMGFSYNKLWKLLIDNNMKKGDLCAKTGLSSSTIAKMTNCESVKLSVLEKICKELDCNFGEIVLIDQNTPGKDDILLVCLQDFKYLGIPVFCCSKGISAVL